MYIPLGDDPVDGGVVPDVVVEKNPQDLIEGRDTELLKVFELIEHQ